MMRAFIAALALACSAGAAWAGDVVRLGGTVSLGDAARLDDTMRLGGTFVDDAETQLVHRWGWGRGWGYGRGWGWGGHHGGYGRSFGYYGGYGGYYGGYRSFYGSYYRPYAWGGWGGGYSRPYAWGGYYQPYYSAYSYPSYSYYAPYAYYRSYAYPVYSYYYAPCAGDELVMPEATTLGSGSTTARVERAMPRADDNGAGANGVYDYNGGPERAVPMPGSGSAPMMAPPPRPLLPRQGRLVSLPASEASPQRANAYQHRAYGEPETPRTQRTAAAPTRATPPVAYPAYGETGATVLTGTGR